MRAVQLTLGIVATAAAIWVAATVVSPAALGPFLAGTLLPIVAVAAFRVRGVAFPLICGAIYAAQAGAQRLVHPTGDPTFSNQLSTAAIVAIGVMVAWRLALWMTAAVFNRKLAS